MACGDPREIEFDGTAGGNEPGAATWEPGDPLRSASEVSVQMSPMEPATDDSAASLPVPEAHPQPHPETRPDREAAERAGGAPGEMAGNSWGTFR